MLYCIYGKCNNLTVEALNGNPVYIRNYPSSCKSLPPQAELFSENHRHCYCSGDLRNTWEGSEKMGKSEDLP